MDDGVCPSTSPHMSHTHMSVRATMTSVRPSAAVGVIWCVMVCHGCATMTSVRPPRWVGGSQMPIVSTGGMRLQQSWGRAADSAPPKVGVIWCVMVCHMVWHGVPWRVMACHGVGPRGRLGAAQGEVARGREMT